MRSHTERASIMYRGTAPASPAPSPQAPAASTQPGQPLSRADAGKVLYKSSSGVTGTIGLALSSTFGRLRAGVQDKSKLAEIDEQRRAVGRLLDERRVDPSDAQKMLSVYVDHKLYTRSTGALDKRWAGPAGFEEVRREAGSDAAAQTWLDRTDRVLRAVAQASPTLARELVNSGAAQHPDFIKLAAKIAEPKPTETKQS